LLFSPDLFFRSGWPSALVFSRFDHFLKTLRSPGRVFAPSILSDLQWCPQTNFFALNWCGFLSRSIGAILFQVLREFRRSRTPFDLILSSACSGARRFCFPNPCEGFGSTAYVHSLFVPSPFSYAFEYPFFDTAFIFST